MIDNTIMLTITILFIIWLVLVLFGIEFNAVFGIFSMFVGVYFAIYMFTILNDILITSVFASMSLLIGIYTLTIRRNR